MNCEIEEYERQLKELNNMIKAREEDIKKKYDLLDKKIIEDLESLVLSGIDIDKARKDLNLDFDVTILIVKNSNKLYNYLSRFH